jgi:predicted ATP-grasp superfamily ATP-dependent carboligase
MAVTWISCTIGQKPRPSTRAMGFYSRYLQERIHFAAGNFREQLRTFLLDKGHRYDVINPIDVSRMVDLLSLDDLPELKSRYLLPGKDSLLLSDNKESIMEHAGKIGLPCPRTFSRVEPQDLDQPERLGITFPCIIKFRGAERMTHWRPEDRYRIAHDREDLKTNYLQMHGIEEYPIIQEYVDGIGVGFFALYDQRGELAAQFCHQRVREYPVSGGPSSCCLSIFDERLIRLGRDLLESLSWRGLAMVEFKYDRNRDQFFLLEVNPRYWGSLPLAVYSGVNFPVLHIMSILGIKFSPVLNYKIGVKMRFIDKDLRSILANLVRKTTLADKAHLLADLFNPSIKEGFLRFDDFPLLYSLLKSQI